jgi:hypothetical protein
MDPLVQSAHEAANQGDKPKATELLKAVLQTNPNDIDSWLLLATLTEDSQRKRQCLNRVLSLDATNKTAREMMLEMDRAEINAYRTRPRPVVVPAAQSQPETSHPPEASFPQRAPAVSTEKPLVFRYSTGWLAVLYIFTTIFCCMGFLLASQSASSATPPFVLALLFGLTAISVSSKTEVKQNGIRTSSLLGGSEMKWDEIASIKSNSMKRRLELTSNTGEQVNVSTQLKGYGVIIEMLRQKRPDLFTVGTPAPIQQSAFPETVEPAPSISRSQSIPVPGTIEPKTFQKSFIRMYGILLVLVPALFLFIWLAFASPESRTAAIVVAVVCVLLMLIPFLQVSSIKVDQNKLTIETFFEQKELSAAQIKEIKMEAVRGRYGRVTNFVQIVPVEGKKYPLGGFSEGEEIIYGYLMNWWNTYQNR